MFGIWGWGKGERGEEMKITGGGKLSCKEKSRGGE